MEEKGRKFGTYVNAVDTATWGTHLALFYLTKQDLVDILVPYFKVGLENNEFCIWITSEPLSETEAGEAMSKALPNLAQYLERGQIEIIPHTEWYLKGGAFNRQRLLNAWVGKYDQALANGYGGMRLTGNTSWLAEEDWENFIDYEEAIDSVIGEHQMLAICTYPLDRCGASEVVDVIRNHQFSLIKRKGEWVLTKPKEGQDITPQAVSERRLTPLQERFIKELNHSKSKNNRLSCPLF